MKISKVKHTKMGVSAQPIEAGGMLYKHPAQGSQKDLMHHIQELNMTAKRLYNVLVSAEDKDLKFAVSKINKIFHDAILSPFEKGKSDQEIYIGLLNGNWGITIPMKTNAGKGESVFGESQATKIVEGTLRQSLRKQIKIDDTKVYAKGVITKLVSAFLSGPAYKESIKSMDEKALICCIHAIREDYTKDTRIKQLAESIAHQNVVVQVDESGEKLVLSSYYNKKKAYIFRFLKAFCEADDAGQKDLLKHMRYLILLYFYGEKLANDAYETDMNEWSFGLTIRENETFFSEELRDLLLTYEEIPGKNKSECRKIRDQIKEEIGHATLLHFDEAKCVDGLSEDDISWLGYISDHVQKLLQKNHVDDTDVKNSYLCKNTWNEWVSYIAMKYIDMGKAAYHFAMEDIDKVAEGDSVSIGQVGEKYKRGLSSFDYERLKADSSFDRSMVQFVAFAVNTFDTSVRPLDMRKRKGMEDILNVPKGQEQYWENAVTRILRFFGGRSSFDGTSLKNVNQDDLISTCKYALYICRNQSFHFANSIIESEPNEVIKAIYHKELSTAGETYRKSMFSNNVPMFYSVSDIDSMMDHVYRRSTQELSQIPSFQKILPRNSNVYNEFINDFITIEGRKAVADPDSMNKLRSCLYFVLKEIYYNDFLKQTDLKRRFTSSLQRLDKGLDEKQKKAHEDFKQRLYVLDKENMSFGEICQQIMTEYNQQNNQMSKRPSAVIDKSGKVREVENTTIYKHYRTLLYIGLRKTFQQYIKEKQEYEFLRSPENRKRLFAELDEREFIRNWKTSMYDELQIGDGTNTLMDSWYITAHFLNQKQLNHLIGQLKTYVQFVKDIERRAKATGNRADWDGKDRLALCEELIAVLGFVKLHCGQISNTLEDYFEDADDYASYVGKYIDYHGNSAAELSAFCNQVIHTKAGNICLGRFFDGMNPILDRNVILSSMYGSSEILSACMSKVTEKTIRDYYKTKDSLDEVFRSGLCKNEEQQKKLKRFQTLKNKIEMVDVLVYTEFLNDVMSQLIGMAYLRERDLMYFQLGFYYTKLVHTNTVPENSFLRVLDGDCHISDGAVLYQIAAMYSYSLPLYGRDSTGRAVMPEKNGNSIAVDVPRFATEYCGSWEIYKNGLCFFEDVEDRHEELIHTREYIDHFKYYAGQSRSIIDLYSDLYGGFFSYNIKLKKNLTTALGNILMSYFVVPTFGYTYENRVVKIGKTNEKEIHVPRLIVKNLKSDFFTYKILDINESEEDDDSIDLNLLAATMMGSGISSKNQTRSNKYRNKNIERDKSGKERVLLIEARNSDFIETIGRLLAYKK